MVITVDQAERLILDRVHSLIPVEADIETVPLLLALGRILAQPVTSALDFPHWDNSAMDGYAVRFADVAQATADHPVTLEIGEEIPAGSPPKQVLQPGQAARIFTGGMMPAGADTIVIQEDTRREGDRVTVLTTPKEGAFVRHRGEYYRAGLPLLPGGIRLGAAEIAVLASAQCAQVVVYRRPRVAILSTGDELVMIDQPLKPGQIVDSNQYALAALVAQAEAEPVSLGIVPDTLEGLRSAISQALATADVVLSSGGVSVGDYDYVEQVLAELGGEIPVRAVAIKPGKPLTVATFSQSDSRPKLYFGLPGNPASAMVTFWRFVQPALRKLSGLAQGWEPKLICARAGETLRSDGKRETYFWGSLHLVEGEYEFRLAGGSQSSANLINLAQTNALAVLSVGQTLISTGETVQVMGTGP